MIVFQFEPTSRQSAEEIYRYNVVVDTLQLSNDIYYKLNTDRIMDTPAFTKFMNEFDDFGEGISSTEVINKANEFLGTLGLSTEIPSLHKETIWDL